jgi:hypothetical protein
MITPRSKRGVSSGMHGEKRNFVVKSYEVHAKDSAIVTKKIFKLILKKWYGRFWTELKSG